MPDFPKPTTEIDDVCAVPLTDVITAYRGSIDLLRAECKKEIDAHKKIEKADPNFGDDIYLLRFVLSHYKKGFKDAQKALLETIQWRAKHAEALYKIRVEGKAPPKDADFRPYCPASPHYRSKNGHLLYVVRNGVSNGQGALTVCKGKEITMWMTFSKEWLHGKVDADTREQNKLIKVIYLMDFRYGTLTGYQGEFKEAMDKASKESELLYPQFLHRTVMYNMPFVIGSVLSFLLQFFPKSIKEKLMVCDESDPEKQLNWTRTKLNISSKEIPSFLGGKCTTCVGGCVRGCPNDQNAALTIDEVKARQSTVATWEQFKARAEERKVAEKLEAQLESSGAHHHHHHKKDKKEKHESEKLAEAAQTANESKS